MNTKNLVISGVGGQGIILLSNLISEVALSNGLDVKKSEVHGMSQRGGSVVSFVRFGEKVSSPLVPLKSADIIVSMELMEGYRWKEYIKNDGIAILNDYRLPPPAVAMGNIKYKNDIIDELKDSGVSVYSDNLVKKAIDLGNSRTVNVILFGMLSKFLDFDEKEYITALEKKVKPKFIEINKKAFILGKELINN